jgi:type IV secretion system protein VirB8
VGTPNFQEGLSLQWERFEMAVRSKRWAWCAAAAALAVAALEAAALVVLMPLKEYRDRVWSPDPKTGAYREVKAIADLDLTQDEALSEWNLLHYIVARETWDPAVGRENHNIVYAYSTPEIWDAYVPLNERGKPGSRVDLYGREAVQVKVDSISFLARDRALVRFSTTRATQGTTEHWISTVGFVYVAPPSEFTARQQNPLGFLVSYYRRDQEVIHADRNS